MEKGVKTLSGVCRKLPDIPFIFVGNEPLVSECQNVANIHDVGFQTQGQLKKLVAHAKFVVTPSEWYEPFGLSVVEAISIRTPVVGQT